MAEEGLEDELGVLPLNRHDNLVRCGQVHHVTEGLLVTVKVGKHKQVDSHDITEVSLGAKPCWQMGAWLGIAMTDFTMQLQGKALSCLAAA